MAVIPIAKRIINQMMPKGNVAKQLPYMAQTATGGSETLDLTSFISNNNIDQIQAAFIDNSQGSSTFVIAMQSSGMVLRCPAGYQGWCPILISYPTGGEITFSGAGHLTPVFFTNVPMPVGFWPATSPLAASLSVIWDDFSQTVGPASIELFPDLLSTNRRRRYVFVKAPELDDLWVNRLGGEASVNGLGCFKIIKANVYENFDGESCSQQWNMFCATGGLNMSGLSQDYY